MAVRNYSLGQLNPVVYFTNSRGEISLPPSTEAALTIKDIMGKRGWELREAKTLAEIDRLQALLQDQEYQAKQAWMEKEAPIAAQVRKNVRDRLVATMVSSSTSPYERDFIQSYLMLREEKREEFQKRFQQDQMYFEAREFNHAHHMQDAVAKVPEARDVACTRCGGNRRVKGLTVCLPCANQIGVRGMGETHGR